MSEFYIDLINGDCLEEIKNIEIGSVDMILTDPPYELSKKQGWWHDGQRWSKVHGRG